MFKHRTEYFNVQIKSIRRSKYDGQILFREILQLWVEGDRLSSDVNLALAKDDRGRKAGEILAIAASLDDKVAFLWVHPAHYRKGIGRAMLDIVETELKKSGFKTASWNVSAITTGP